MTDNEQSAPNLDGCKLTDEELDKFTVLCLTQDDKDELESMASIGLVANDEEDTKEYYRRLNYLYDLRIKQKVAAAQRAKLQAYITAREEAARKEERDRIYTDWIKNGNLPKSSDELAELEAGK